MCYSVFHISSYFFLFIKISFCPNPIKLFSYLFYNCITYFLTFSSQSTWKCYLHMVWGRGKLLLYFHINSFPIKCSVSITVIYKQLVTTGMVQGLVNRPINLSKSLNPKLHIYSSWFMSIMPPQKKMIFSININVH